MVNLIAYIIAIVITCVMAVALCPIAAVFWVVGLFGHVGNYMFSFISKVLKHIWSELVDSENNSTENVTTEDIYRQ
jgi:hypothetical protein